MDVDFRYAPEFWQTMFCFPDDEYKSIVGKNGELMYGHPGPEHDINFFSQVVNVGIEGINDVKFISQRLVAPNIPIVITENNCGDVSIKLITYASKFMGEGRVDNLVIKITGKVEDRRPVITVNSSEKLRAVNLKVKAPSRYAGAVYRGEGENLFMLVNSAVKMRREGDLYYFYLESRRKAFFVRFPQEGQPLERIIKYLRKPYKLLEEVSRFWCEWRPFKSGVWWKLNKEYQNFLVACSRNIVQARIVKDGRRIFQVGPTVYRGLWIIDGIFILEAARYLGYDKEAQEGIEYIWSLQEKDGGIFASAGRTHWKDTAGAIYAIIRQAELSQNWRYFLKMWPKVIRAFNFIKKIREKARNDGSPNGKYGLLPCGYGDSGIGGMRRPELANTLWTLIGLKALVDISRQLKMKEFCEIKAFYIDLLNSFMRAAKAEMRCHPKGFSYLPMLMRDDPGWSKTDVRKQPRPQVAQCYVSHAIYPGLLFSKDNPILEGHIKLMKSIVEEDVPIETGWLSDGGVWTYNAPMVAQVYLWLGMRREAKRTFIGFLNHASPLYAWREEQSLKNASSIKYIGDMPHNWASAECIRFLRHMFILEDGKKIRLLEGIDSDELADENVFVLLYSPTRWGKVSVVVDVGSKGVKLKFIREKFSNEFIPELKNIEIPIKLPGGFKFHSISGAGFRKGCRKVYIDPSATKFDAYYRR
jgi:hypothetical protein